MSRICLYYVSEPERDRWVMGDRHVRQFIRKIIRGASRPGGVDKVFINLCLGLDKLEIPYEVNLPFEQLQKGDRVGVLGRGRNCLNGYNQPNPIVAGIGLMTHPSEWPNLCEEYPVVKYLQHSDWANDVYKPYFGDHCDIWAVGINTDLWQPTLYENKSVDFLLYNKIMWDYDQRVGDLLTPIREYLNQQGLTFEELRYGSYKQQDFQAALSRCRAMIFLCEHESQGIAYQECLASDVPILAWEQGKYLDPRRFAWGIPSVSASSVPYWDERCGIKFQNINEFPTKLAEFLEKLNQKQFHPRDYILENLTLEICALNYIEILNQAKENLTGESRLNG
jgi:hypothetical protein